MNTKFKKIIQGFYGSKANIYKKLKNVSSIWIFFKYITDVVMKQLIL